MVGRLLSFHHRFSLKIRSKINRMIPKIMSTTTLNVLGVAGLRCIRRTANQPMQTRTIDKMTLGTMSCQTRPCDGEASEYTTPSTIARATRYQKGFVLWGGTFESRRGGMTASNEKEI